MGKKKIPTDDAAEKAKRLEELKEKHKKELEPMGGEKALDEEVPDTPIVKKLKEIDDKYLALEKEFELKMQALELEMLEKQAPLLKKRADMLGEAPADGEAAPATPACRGFWLKALKNLPEVEEYIEEHDEPVLEYLKDIRYKLAADGKEVSHGFSLTFDFAENPYFDHKELSKTYHCKETNPWIDQIDVTKIESTEIQWKDGKDPTVEKTQKKTKGGGAKKAKQKAKMTIEPRPSFFRLFFQSLEADAEMPEALQCYVDAEDDDDEEPDNEQVMEQDHDIAERIKSSLIPYAVRWYTGEARPESDDEWEEDSEEEDLDDDDEDDDDDDDDDEDDEPAPKKGAKAKKGAAKAKAKGGDGKEEECKQQ